MVARVLWACPEGSRWSRKQLSWRLLSRKRVQRGQSYTSVTKEARAGVEADSAELLVTAECLRK